VGNREGRFRLARFETDTTIALRHAMLHYSFWNVAPHRVRRLAHSLKRDIGSVDANRRTDSPMSMTSPMTTLTRGQYAPLLHRSSAAPRSTSPQHVNNVFLRRDLRLRADYFANPSTPTSSMNDSRPGTTITQQSAADDCAQARRTERPGLRVPLRRCQAGVSLRSAGRRPGGTLRRPAAARPSVV
jgi:hypothetical protein